jgi:ATP/maltotriose-dependent transcriptional regulator MalT
MQLHGEWRDAGEEARQACEHLQGHPALGAAHYQQAELHRLRGDFDRADAAYRLASQWGREPQPGLAQLRLAQGQVGAAEAAIRRVVGDGGIGLSRSRVLAAFVDIMVAAGDLTAARAAADELTAMTDELDANFLRALADHATGSVLLAAGDPRRAAEVLRRSWGHWRAVEAPYEAARVRVLIGLACRALGDEDTAEMELDAARTVFRQLGAGPDLERVEELSPSSTVEPAGGLTEREVEVLVLVASGKTNREIAADLVISEHTVARHLQNMFVKLGVSSRTAASAFAFEHRLL